MSLTSLSTDGASMMESVLISESGTSDGQNFAHQLMNDISGPLSRNMLDKIGLNHTAKKPFKLLEHGCGLGIIASTLMESVPPHVLKQSSMLCGDFSEPLVAFVKGRIANQNWGDVVEARVLDASKSGLPSDSFTHVVSNLVYHVVPDSKAALQDSIRVLAPGGTLAFTTWHAYNPFFAVHFRDALAAQPTHLLPPNFEFHFPTQTTGWGHWDDLDWLHATLVDSGLEDVHVEPLASAVRVENVDYFMRMTDQMFPMMAKMVLGEESTAKLGGLDGLKEKVRVYLEGQFGDKGWTLTGVSLCSWGRKKGPASV